MVEKGTVDARNGKADATTMRLMALLRITACKAANRKPPISSGNRNSAPPSPISPPSAPMIAPPAKTIEALRAGCQGGGRHDGSWRYVLTTPIAMCKATLPALGQSPWSSRPASRVAECSAAKTA